MKIQQVVSGASAAVALQKAANIIISNPTKDFVCTKPVKKKTEFRTTWGVLITENRRCNG